MSVSAERAGEARRAPRGCVVQSEALPLFNPLPTGQVDERAPPSPALRVISRLLHSITSFHT